VKERAAARAAELLRRHRVAALGTLHDAAPSVTMAPYALVADPFALIVLVSGLASHTADMRAHARVGVLVAEPEADGYSVHTLARVAMQADARALAAGDALHQTARHAYASRFADMTGLFSLGDFTLFALVPTAVRVVAGFAQAASITPAALAAAIRGGDDAGSARAR
jgi:putative heme iron utilization protein